MKGHQIRLAVNTNSSEHELDMDQYPKSRMLLSPEWGKMRLQPIRVPAHFWALLHEVGDDIDPVHGGIGINMDTILQAFCDRTLFGVCLEENDHMYQHGIASDPVFAYGPGGSYLLPCFCIPEVGNRNVELIWVHPRVRRQGLATFMVRSLGLSSLSRMIPSSLLFWEHLGAFALRPPPIVDADSLDTTGDWWLEVRASPQQWTTKALAQVVTELTRIGPPVSLSQITEGGFQVCDGRSLRARGLHDWPWIDDPKKTLEDWLTATDPTSLVRDVPPFAIVRWVTRGHPWSISQVWAVAQAFFNVGIAFHNWNCTVQTLPVL